MSAVFDPGPAASALADALKTGRQLVELPVEIRPSTLSQGYDVQDRFLALLDEPVAGWKLGVGSPKGKRDTGLDRAIAGRVLTSRLHRSGETARLPNRAPATVEFEICFVLGRDVEPGAVSGSPMVAVSAAHVAFELVLSRFVDRRAVGWPSFAADNAAFQALVLGEAVDPARIGEIAGAVVVSADGKEMAGGLVGDDAIDPVGALSEMFAHARERGITLPAGTLVSTGTLSKPFTVAGHGADIVARFPGSALRIRTSVPEMPDLATP
ncbi:2-keto-4-pentenoate hydratase [Telmatospirillum siberiense]|uniref:Hydratase n=1 Tax=Telmatospirillum siberiense TaxID=382514 RepID=A0A2N3PUE9_9PROT|nr:fumarylacetoacetate hydrolase family protein [Telmatospirillum siberiense]PKU24027.1 hydratase [Telmatospirillum siberiense]